MQEDGWRVGAATPTLRTTTCREVIVHLTYTRPPRRQGGLYLIRLSDRHYYGGRAKCFQTRWAVHSRLFRENKHFNPHAQAVFNQHGRFDPEVLCILPVENQHAAEQVWLDKNFDNSGCVNLSRSSDGVHAGYRHSEATRAKHRRPIHTPASKEKCRQAACCFRPNYTPHPQTDESRVKLSLSVKQAWKRETVAGIKRAGFSGNHSDEAKRKMSEVKLGKPHPHKGTAKTEEQRDRQAQKMREWWSDGDRRDKASERQKGRPATKGMTGRKHSPETKRKMSEARKACFARCKDEGGQA